MECQIQTQEIDPKKTELMKFTFYHYKHLT